MAANKFVIEKEECEWYTDFNMTTSSKDITDAYLFDIDRIIFILNHIEKSNLFRIEHISCKNYNVIESLTSEIAEWYNILWNERDSWEGNTNRIRSFIKSECLDILDESISNHNVYSLMIYECAKDIGRKLCNSEVI